MAMIVFWGIQKNLKYMFFIKWTLEEHIQHMKSFMNDSKNRIKNVIKYNYFNYRLKILS